MQAELQSYHTFDSTQVACYARSSALSQRRAADAPEASLHTLGSFVLALQVQDAVAKSGVYDWTARLEISFGPGTLFSATDRYRNCIRLGCAEPWSPRVHQAIAKIGELAQKQL